MLSLTWSLTLMPRIVPLAVAESRRLIERASSAAELPSRRRELLASCGMYDDSLPDLGSIGIVSGDAVCAIALLQRKDEGVVLCDVATFDDTSGTQLVYALHKALGLTLGAHATLGPRWRVAHAYFAKEAGDG